jgi:hypothetical protein
MGLQKSNGDLQKSRRLGFTFTFHFNVIQKLQSFVSVNASVFLSVVKFALYYIILEESVYFYNPDHVKSDYFYRKGLSINCCLIYVKS